MRAHKNLGSLTLGLLAVLACAAGSARSASAATVAAVSGNQANETLHVVVGHSMVLDTPVALKRVYIGNPTVLLSYTASANEIVLTGKATGASSLLVWDVAGVSKLYNVEVDLDPAEVQDALKVEFPNEQITATVSEDHISLSGNVTTPEIAEAARKLAENYSKLVVSSLRVTGHPQEVRLKVRIAEVDRTKLVQFGVNLLSTGKNIASTSTGQYSSTSLASIATGAVQSTTVNISNPLNFFVFNTEYNVGLSVADLAQHNLLQILAEPTLTSMSGVPASFLSGGEFPFPTIQASAGSTPVVTISFRPYGIKVDFTPVVGPDGIIRLKVAPEVSSLDYSNAVQISGYTIPAIATRRAETQVELKSGQSFMISGLLDHQTTEQFARTPGISSIPILGELFKSKNNNHSVTELMVIVTADLVDPNTEATPPLPKNSVPSMEPDAFDHQINKNHAADPNTNRDTGKAAQPVAPQNQPAAAAAPVTAANTVPAGAATPAPATTTVAAAQVPARSAPAIDAPSAVMAANPAVADSGPTPSKAQATNTQVAEARAPQPAQPSQTNVTPSMQPATATTTTTTMHLRLKSVNQ